MAYSDFDPNSRSDAGDGTDVSNDVQIQPVMAGTDFLGAPLPTYTMDQVASYLTNGFWSDTGRARHAFAGNTITYNIENLTPDGQRLAQEALTTWAGVTGLTFARVISGGQISFDDNEADAFATYVSRGGVTQSANVNISTDWLNTYGTGRNSYSLTTYIHEIGHALGLGHAGNYNGMANWSATSGASNHFLNDSWQATVMSYFDQDDNTAVNASRAFVIGPMLADIIAVQSLYGVPTNVRTGDTIYGFNSNSIAEHNFAQYAQGNMVAFGIFDSGGIDTIDTSGFSVAQLIDLRPGTYSNIGGEVGNVGIAANTLIEKAFGGTGDDAFTGNTADNTFWGSAGSDSFRGLEGSDVFDGGSGSDNAIFQGLSSQYTITRLDNGYIRVLDNVAGRDGLDFLIDTEFLTFTDTTISAAGISSVFGTTTSQAFAMTPMGGGWNSQNQFPRQLADINGDGIVDVVGFGSAGVYTTATNGGANFTMEAFGNGGSAGGWSSQNEFPRLLADVNGDGKDDIVAFGHAGVIVALATNNFQFGAPTQVNSEFGYTNGGWTSQERFSRQLADVNGDGRADVVGFGNAGVYVALGQADGTFAASTVASNNFGYLPVGGSWTGQDRFPRMLGDVNGDGRADIVAFGNAGVYVALGQANGTFGAAAFVKNDFGYLPQGGSWTSQDRYPRMLGDVNGDGRADIVGFGNAGVYVAFGAADGTFGATTFVKDEYGYLAGGWQSQDRHPRFVMDVDGNGTADIVGFGEAGLYFTPGLPPSADLGNALANVEQANVPTWSDTTPEMDHYADTVSSIDLYSVSFASNLSDAHSIDKVPSDWSI